MKKRIIVLFSVFVALLLAGCTLSQNSLFGEPPEYDDSNPDNWADSSKQEAITRAGVASSRRELHETLLSCGLSPLYDYALENCSVDWKEKAVTMAKDAPIGSPSEIKTLLQEEDFLSDEIEYAMANCGIDWNEYARVEVFVSDSYFSYNKINPQYRTFSETEVSEDLKKRGFSEDNIDYALSYGNYHWGINARDYLIDAAEEQFDTIGDTVIPDGYTIMGTESEYRNRLLDKGFTESEVDYAISNLPSGYSFLVDFNNLP